MNKEKKTYGIKGYMEYQAVIKVGKSRMKVPFSDGSMTAMGVEPCTFTTESYMIQQAIENSAEFKRGLIYIVNSTTLDGKVEIERRSPRPTVASVKPYPKAIPEIASSAESEEKPAAESEEKPAMVAVATEEGVVEKPIEEVWPSKSEEGETADEGATLTQVEFASNDEAKDYLEQNFGYVRSKLRNRESIIAAGKASGVEIVFD